jgi:hypothetical protein
MTVDNEKLRLDAVSNALSAMGESIGELSAGLERALRTITEEAEVQTVVNGRIEAKVNVVHDLVNSTYSAALAAQKKALEQLIEYMNADLLHHDSDEVSGKRKDAVQQLGEVNQTIEDREKGSDSA